MFRLHSALGVISAVGLAVVSASGAALVFHGELDRALSPELHRVEPGPRRVSYDEIFEGSRRRHPDAHAVRIWRFPAAPDRPVELQISRLEEGAEAWRFEYVDPYTGHVLGARAGGGEASLSAHPMDVLLWLHTSFLLGKRGQAAVALLSILVLASVLTGLIVYRRSVTKILLFRVPLRLRGSRAGSSTLHRVLGVWSALFLVVIASTGLFMLRAVFTSSFWEAPAPRPPQPALTFSIDALLARAREDAPAFVPRGMRRITGDGESALFGDQRNRSFLLGEYSSEVKFDARTGEIRKIRLTNDRSPAGKLESMVGPAHFGTWGGTPVRVLYMLLGLAPLLLSITGLYLWWRRRSAGVPRRRGEAYFRPAQPARDARTEGPEHLTARVR
ncbi:PepSY-associated TM helix domain-containing protein [Sorangium sp. So ce119]|uniref:PepSY-associated TM helix domain-containing protein n=1 Tax=Sorangium sp. So ce119 TaxID=3133279 RepID=UPI003F619A66